MEAKSDSLLSQLDESGITRKLDRGLVLTDDFESRIDDKNTERVVEEVTSLVGNHETIADLHGPKSELNNEYFKVYATLNEYFPEMETEYGLQLAVILTSIKRGPPNDEGSPREFFPIPGEVLPQLLAVYERAIIYIWSTDCDPCDTMKKRLNNILEEQPEDVGLFSVYGPACAKFLQEEYRVIGGPTLLFAYNGEIDVRLLGDTKEPVVESEIQKLREL
jgi:thiol-disulfide isomerase/thioredoxin